MSSSILKAESRKALGSRHSRNLRAEGQIPASVQGGDGEHLNISVNSADFWTARRQHVHLFDLEIDGNTESAVVRELQWDTMGDELNHVEFMRVVRGVEIESEIELEFTGTPKDGILTHLTTHLHVRCIPSLIPDSIEVLVGQMSLGHPLTAGELVLPEGISLVTPAETQVAVVSEAQGVDEPSDDDDDDDIVDIGAPAPAPTED